MEKRTLIALVLITLVFLISNQFIWKNNQNTQSVQKPDSLSNVQNSTIPDTVKTVKTFIDTAIVKQTEIEQNDNITLQNDLVKYIFSNKGAVVKQIYLKKYKGPDKKSIVNLLPDGKSLFNISVNFSNNTQVDFKDFLYNYKINGNQLIFKINTFAGIITKKFILDDTSYSLDFSIESVNGNKITSYALDMSSGLNETEIFNKMKNYDYKFEADVENEVYKLKLSKLLKKSSSISGRVNWAAIKSKFFIISIIPDELIITKKIEGFKVRFKDKKGEETFSPGMKLYVSNKDLTVNNKYKLYIGPIILKNLTAYNVGLENAVELGPKWLRWISTFFLKVLLLIHKIIPSWGIAIIIFSLILKLALFPFTHKSFESASKMQKLQPKLKEVQRKYKHDPRLLQAETSKLYKEHGVNPFGGCLPLLIQLPILYALYPVLRYSIDLRQTAFLYIKDLSAPDPYYVLPLLMALFMFVQQKISAPPKSENMDEKEKAAASSQKMMMYFMPIFLFWIFKSLPAGLMLYWTISNIISTIQQYYIKKKFANTQLQTTSEVK